MGDLYSGWIGTRDLLVRGRNPFGPEVSHQSQMPAAAVALAPVIELGWPMPNHGENRPTLIPVFSDQRRTRSTT